MKIETIQFRAVADDAERGKPGNCQECVLARAIKRRLGVLRVEVHLDHVAMFWPGQATVYARTSADMADVIDGYDRSWGEIAVALSDKPFDFFLTMEVPNDWTPGPLEPEI